MQLGVGDAHADDNIRALEIHAPTQIQTDATQIMTRALAVAALFDDRDASTRELEDARSQLRLVLATLLTQQQIGAQLLKEYENVLTEH
jgi:hypothetical protein